MRSLRTLLCALCVGLATASGASANTTTWFGLNDSSVTAGQLSATKAASISQNLNASSARIGLNWSWVQPTNSAPNFSTFDAIYQADIADGIHPLITLVGSPSWTWAPGTTCPNGGCVYPPDSLHNSDWQGIAAAIAKRYPQAAGIEIWNEPNMTWEWNSGVDPARYTQLLKLAYTAIKAVNPKMPVIAGALAVDLESSATSSADPLPQFLQAMYQNGAKGYMDGISIHPYPGSMDLFYTFKGISDTTEIRDANRDTVPVWITEAGLSVQQFTQAQQSEVDGELVTALRPYQGLGGLYLSTLVEPATGGSGLGIISSTLSQTPAYCSVATAAGSSYSCPSTVIVPSPSLTQKGRWQAQTLLQYAANAAIAYRAAHGTYTGMTSSALHAIDARISATPAGGTNAGPTADPSQVGVYPMSSGTAILLCNASTADLSYCTGGSYLSGWN
jgi:hypothetical protein